MQELKVGQVAVSTAGRDKGRKFVILSIINSQYVYISDGDSRKLEKPKKKNIKHLKGTDHFSEDIKGRLEAGKKISNSEIRKLLKSID